MPELNADTEKAMEEYIEELLAQQKNVLDVQSMTKLKFEKEIKAELGESGFETFEVPINRIRTLHHHLCKRNKSFFECAGLFEDKPE